HLVPAFRKIREVRRALELETDADLCLPRRDYVQNSDVTHAGVVVRQRAVVLDAGGRVDVEEILNVERQPHPLAGLGESKILVDAHLHVVQRRQFIGAARLRKNGARALTERHSDDSSVRTTRVAEVRGAEMNPPWSFPRTR